MTANARRCLADCQRLLNRLTHRDYTDAARDWSDDWTADWRIDWTALLALLRTVGNVLENVDSKTNPNLAKAVDRAYSKLRTDRPPVFWEFIRQERNNILKEYKMGGQHVSARSNACTSLWVAAPGRAAGDVFVTAKRQGRLAVHVHYYDEGPFCGRDQLDVAKEAIQWWKSYLDQIDADVAARQT